MRTNVRQHIRKTKRKYVRVRQHTRKNRGVLVGRSYKLNPNDKYFGNETIKDIDQSIVKYLERINKAGYKTESSCSGRACDHDYYLVSDLSKDKNTNIISVSKGTQPKWWENIDKTSLKKIQRNSPAWKELDRKTRLLMAVPGISFKLPKDIMEQKTGYKDNKPISYVHFHKPTTVRKVIDAVSDAGFQSEIRPLRDDVLIHAHIPEKNLTSRQLKQRFRRLTNILEKRDIE